MKISRVLASIAVLSCFNVCADSGFYGEANVMANWKSDLDHQTGIATGFAGYKDSLKIKDIGVAYQLEGYYAASGDRFVNLNDSDEFSISVASLAFNTDVGTFYVGKGYSGAYLNLYKRVDIHPFSNSEAYSMNEMLYKQGKYAENILAYFTPWYNSSVGDFQAKFALVNPNCNDGSNDEILVGRLLYSVGNFNAAINLNRIDESYSGDMNKHHYNRYSVGGDYSFEYFKIAYTGEFSENAFYAADLDGYSEQVHTVALLANVNDFKYGISYQLRDSDLEARDDVGLVIGSVTYSYAEELDFMVEYANYTGDNDSFEYNKEHSFTMGARYRF
ncbi:hypothetical protein [Shewanella youngdeokensis]|uniref:Porin n=1 Tax=Shewanella youngdeokensis TaxID=2999068 RepID=A0ABZ0K1M1_9GAMM|nr:hypothetical protein RGE70_05975 [Shewanella sp. DAU334]